VKRKAKVDVSYENVLEVFNCLLLLLEYIADLGGDIGCRGGGRFGRGRPEEPEEGGAIAAGSLRAIRDGRRCYRSRQPEGDPG
jgi:hypothetical protein